MAGWYEEEFNQKFRVAFRVERTLFSGQSEYQRVEILQSPQWGRVLVLDGMLMTSEVDEFFYHEMLVHPAMISLPQAAQNVLVIGGGDGGTIREVLKHSSVQKVTLVEIDGMVIDACKEHLPALGSSAWKDPRLDLQVGDGVAFVANAKAEHYDLVLLDGTDPVGPGEGLFGREFFANCKRILKAHGAFAMQSESPLLFEKVFFETQSVLSEIFERVQPYLGPVPLYGSGTWSWTWCAKQGDPLAIVDERAAAIEKGARYYNRGIHRGAFSIPNFIAERLKR